MAITSRAYLYFPYVTHFDKDTMFQTVYGGEYSKYTNYMGKGT